MPALPVGSTLRTTAISVAATLLLATPVQAEDIAVYTARLENSQRPNVLFVLDFSGSMQYDINNVSDSPPPGESKIDILKQAVSDVLDQNAGLVNVGIGSIYADRPSGVRWPVTDLEVDANLIDPDIPAGVFTAKDLIIKQLERRGAHGATATVNALAEAAHYYRGDPVTFDTIAEQRPSYQEPDVWDVGNARYQSGNSYAAMPSSYAPSDAFKTGVPFTGQYEFCYDSSATGGNNGCLDRVTFECTDVSHDAGSSGSGETFSSWGAANYRRCKFESDERWDGADYVSPISHECQANYIVLISDGEPTRLSDNDSLRDLVGDVSSCEDLSGSIFGAGPGGAAYGNCGPEILEQLANNDQNPTIANSKVKTYTIGFSVEGPGQDYLKRLAEAGDGEFFEANRPNELSEVLSDLIAGLALSSESFAELSVDVNKSTFSHDNKAFFNIFEPSVQRGWRGNLKGYFLNEYGLLDVHGSVATEDTPNGLALKETAQSFWSSAPDGDVVSAGGASQGIENGNRDLYTFTGSTIPNGGVNLALGNTHELLVSNGAVTPAMMGVSAGVRDTLIDWLQTAPMGDPLHSKAVSVNYGTQQVVFSMTNQGFLHAFDATLPVDPGSGAATGGEELFAFMPQALLKNVQDLYDTGSRGPHVYGLDGGLSRVHNDLNNDGIVNGADTVMLVFGMRRGGNAYYAVDVTSPTSPKLMWRIDNTTPGFGNLAQSWSRMSLVTVKRNGTQQKVLMFAGGYDAATLDGNSTRLDASGNAIYITDLDGNLLWSVSGTQEADMRYSIPSDLTVIDSDADGAADRLYVGDLGGQVWRVDFDDVALSGDFAVTRLADLDNGNLQPFFYPPSVALNRTSSGDYLSVALGSGNRTQPLDDGSANGFFVIRDDDVETGRPAPGHTTVLASDLFDNTAAATASTNATTAQTATDALEAARGWFVALLPGEKSLSRVVAYDGQLLATTFSADVSHAGAAGACGFSTSPRFYQMDIRNGEPLQFNADGSATDTVLTAANRSTLLRGEGIPTSPVVVFPEGSGQVQIIVGKETVSRVNQPLQRVYWHSK